MSAAMEHIVCAALRRQDGGLIFSLPRPARHHDIILQCSNNWVRNTFRDAPDQGFLTSTGRFVDRSEGLQIAAEAGQIVEKHGPADTLFSEDMW